MNILLLSDTHSHFDDWMQKHILEADEVWNAGDVGDVSVIHKIEALKPLRAVYGNIDGAEVRTICPLNLFFKADGLKVFMTHIGGYPKRYNQRVKKILQEHRPALYICGHSHILKVMNDAQLDCLHMNPGAVGKHGFHHKRTMLKFKIVDGNITDLFVIEKERV